jgi:hypothetical protein
MTQLSAVNCRQQTQQHKVAMSAQYQKTITIALEVRQSRSDRSIMIEQIADVGIHAIPIKAVLIGSLDLLPQDQLAVTYYGNFLPAASTT